MDLDDVSDRHPKNSLLEHDWQLKYVLASNTSNMLDVPLAQFTFYTVENFVPAVSTEFKKVDIEFNKTELKDLINTLQKAISK